MGTGSEVAGGTGSEVGGTGWDVNLPFSGHQGSNDIGFGITGGQGGTDRDQDGTLSGDIFCPWSAEVVSVEPGG